MVVTGVPGSGKTTLGLALARVLGAHFLALDAIKDRLFAESAAALEGFALRLAAEEQLRDELVAVAGRAVVDIWVQPGRDTARVAKLLSGWAQVAEVMCCVPAEVAVDRYRRRVRQGPHKPPDPETLDRIRSAAETLAPLGIGPCTQVDTSTEVDLVELVGCLERLMASLRPGGQSR